MKLQTHIAVGILFAMIFYYFLKLDLTFALLVGLASFIPDIDWAMQFKWGMGNRHRTFMHNIWAMIIILIVAFLLTKSLIIIFGVVLGFVGHLLADSLTVTGVYWLWPYGDEKRGGQKKYWTGWKLNMSDPNENKIERIIQIVALAISGFIFLAKDFAFGNIFSLNGLITIVILLFAGYILMKQFRSAIVKIIRRLKI